MVEPTTLRRAEFPGNPAPQIGAAVLLFDFLIGASILPRVVPEHHARALLPGDVEQVEVSSSRSGDEIALFFFRFFDAGAHNRLSVHLAIAQVVPLRSAAIGARSWHRRANRRPATIGQP
jgi:hypothetical protein